MNAMTFDVLDTHFKTCTTDLEGKTEPSEIIPLIKNEFSAYPEAIRLFFVGKQEEIKKIYNSIRSNEFPYNKVNCVDVANARTLFIDYLDGMTEYLHRVMDLEDTDSIDPNIITSSLEQMLQKNREYTNSIFGGDENPRNDVTINEAMTFVELFIDFESDLSKFTSGIVDTLNFMNQNTTQKYHDVMRKAVTQLYIHSIRNYVYNFSKYILECYSRICKSVQARTPVGGVTEAPQFQLF